jgi:hypothetical protein
MITGKTGLLATLIEVLQSLISEWGSENILLAVPLQWEALGHLLPAEQRESMVFTNEDTVSVSAFYGGTRHVHYELVASLLIDERQAESQACEQNPVTGGVSTV